MHQGDEKVQVKCQKDCHDCYDTFAKFNSAKKLILRIPAQCLQHNGHVQRTFLITAAGIIKGDLLYDTHEYSLSTSFFLPCVFFHFPRSPFHPLAPGCPGHPFSPTVIEILSHYVILQGASNNYENEVNYVGHIVQQSSNSNALFRIVSTDYGGTKRHK